MAAGSGGRGGGSGDPVRRGAAADPRRLSHGGIGPWGARRQRTSAPRRPKAPPPTAAAQFACEQCGAVLSYAPGTSQLVCSYCGHRNQIAEAPIEVVEHAGAWHRGCDAPSRDPCTRQCTTCGAQVSSSRRAFAAARSAASRWSPTPAPTARSVRSAVLPFANQRQESARERVSEWLKGLWFAPSKPSRAARGPKAAAGMYLPYWTYDSHTQTDYLGQRGTSISRRCVSAPVINGRRVAQTEMVQKSAGTRPWLGRPPFRRRVVLASRSLPAQLVDRLGPGPGRNAALHAGVSERVPE